MTNRITIERDTDGKPAAISIDVGRRWMPSNGTEGASFEERFCQQCIREQWSEDNEDGARCEILTAAHLADPAEPLSGPVQWREIEGRAFCTEFVARPGSLTPLDMRARCRCEHSGAWHESTVGKCARPECGCVVMRVTE